MIDGGEDPLYIARRLVRMATEDVGLADPAALRVTLAARDAFRFLGAPEGELALAAVYLATAPKSNRLYLAWQAASRRARETTGERVPLHIRNAPTQLMKELGYGREYATTRTRSTVSPTRAICPTGWPGSASTSPGRTVRNRASGSASSGGPKSVAQRGSVLSPMGRTGESRGAASHPRGRASAGHRLDSPSISNAA